MSWTTLISATEAVGSVLSALLSAIAIIFSIKAFRNSVITSNQQLRAYVGTSSGRNAWDGLAEDNRDPNKKYKLEYSIKIINSGSTPAIHMRNISKISVFSLDNYKESDFALQFPDFYSDATLNPNDYRNITVSSLFSENELNDLSQNTSKEKIFIYGKIEYEDIFENRRYTNFCYMFNINIKNKRSNIQSFIIHNDSN